MQSPWAQMPAEGSPPAVAVDPKMIPWLMMQQKLAAAEPPPPPPPPPNPAATAIANYFRKR